MGNHVKTVYAYNVNKAFHTRGNNWVGYLLNLYGNTYYIAGDTDIMEENKKVICDVAFVPVGGTYTMDGKEAAELINIIKPKVAVPVHYESIVGKQEDAELFIRSLDEGITGKIIMSEA